MQAALNPQEIKANLLSGMTVALAMVPEAVAFALVAQVDPLAGLYAALSPPSASSSRSSH